VIERVNGHKETISNQEEIIRNLAHQIKAHAMEEEGDHRQRESDVLIGDLQFKKE